MGIYEWGVDSAEDVTEELFQCVVRNFGHPVFWGRYLVRVPAVSEGLTRQEISWIHSQDIKILPVYNAFREARGYFPGREAAIDAAYHAENLGAPKGVPIFANMERFFPVDSAWIRGWTEGLLASGYRSGIYNDPVTGGFHEAFCNAVNENAGIVLQNILWSAEPETEPGGPWDAPDYDPEAPDCGGIVSVWQYSRRLTRCPVDFNLAAGSLVNILW